MFELRYSFEYSYIAELKAWLSPAAPHRPFPTSKKINVIKNASLGSHMLSSCYHLLHTSRVITMCSPADRKATILSTQTQNQTQDQTQDDPNILQDQRQMDHQSLKECTACTGVFEEADISKSLATTCSASLVLTNSLRQLQNTSSSFRRNVTEILFPSVNGRRS